MKKYVRFASVVFALNSASVFAAGNDPAVATTVQHAVRSGTDIARELNTRYAEKVENCGSNSRPSFLCSGVLLRGVDSSGTNYNSWDLSDSVIASGGVTFSFLRNDDKFTRFSNNRVNGFIFYPILNTPTGKQQIEVLCSFPLQADPAHRAQQGCGAHSSYLTSSRKCHELSTPVTTAAEWRDHFETTGIENRNEHQCGFDVSDNINQYSAANFNASIAARKLVSAAYQAEQGDVRMALWKNGTGSTLPVEAFFYLQGNSAGLAGAQYDQRQFNANTGIVLPVIALKLPASMNDQASFSFNQADQKVN